MFVVKFYSADGYRQIIEEADSLSILRDGKTENAEITLHRKSGESVRRDINDEPAPDDVAWPPRFVRAIVENSAGKTTEMVGLRGPGRRTA